jgi:acetyl-CoA carboxylase carboxyl transferase subunit beta
LKLHNAFKKKKNEYVTLKVNTADVPKGIIRKCKKCGTVVLAEDVKERGYICPKCGGYFRMHARRRIESIADTESFEEWFTGLNTNNPLDFEDYPKKIEQLRKKTKLDEAVTTGKITIEGHCAAIAVLDGRFMMASMGQVVGEKITRTVEKATEENLPLIIFSCSGGARMQEGIVSLMQMAKTSAALKRHSAGGNLYISVLTDPTTGGVTASFAMLGDIILAEPKALIGFAGPRVIEQTIGQKLPKGFQRSEFLLEHGFIDAIVERNGMKKALATILKLHSKKAESLELNNLNSDRKENRLPEIINDSLNKNFKAKDYLSSWDRVVLSRKNNRPVGQDYIENLFDDFMEFHGDRYFKDDTAIIGGIATFKGMPVTVIAQAKGHNTKENVNRNFGMPSPDGYRKALRLMKQAEKFKRPVICFVDTPGAFCGLDAEERGQGEAIARNLYEMSALRTPILTIMIGEGGSGGALAMAVADKVWMLENSVYSILSPEGYASILWKDSKRAKEAAKVMKMTAFDLYEMGIVEKVFAEPESYTIETMSFVLNNLKPAIELFLAENKEKNTDDLLESRYKRFRKM